MLCPITTIKHQLGVNLWCIVAFHMLKTMFHYQLYIKHGNKYKMDIKIIWLMLSPIITIRHQLGVDLSCIVDFHMLKTMFYYQL